MFFGLTNSPATFQTIMNKLLRDLINIGKVVVFINDMIVGTEEEEEHDEIVEKVVRRLAENNLYVKPEKCKQKVREVGFLGVVIKLKGIKMEKEKINSVLDQPALKYIKDIQNFLGLANYYHQFIQGFVSIARPLYNIVRKDQKWEWTERQKEVFKELKEKFTKEPVLTVLDLDKKIRIEVDVSDYATEKVLSMKYEDGRWRPVTFLSKLLNEIERNYKIHDKEMLAVIRGLENQRHLLESTKFKFKVWTDYKNLEYFMKAQNLNW